MSEIYAEIISTGNEVLGGRITDTNAAYLSHRLMEIGITPAYRTTVGDDRERYAQVFETALSRVQVVITIGGLGPTEDDLTREVCAKVLGRKLKHSPEADTHIRSVLEKYKIPCEETELRQAFFPEGSVLIPNQSGTACGFVAMHEDQLVASLSGVPSELEWMMELHLFPYLRETFPHLQWIPSMTAMFFGLSESALQRAIQPILKKFPEVTWGMTASQMVLTLSLSCSPGKEDHIGPVLDEIAGALGDEMFGIGETTLAEVVADQVTGSGLTIAIAESCTGGLLSHLLTEVSGVSGCLLESVVTYSDESKIKRLGVRKEILAEHGAVSKEVAAEMAQGVRKTSGADMGVGITGIAGPKGGTEEKPVGLVYISIAIDENPLTIKYEFTGSRSDIKMRAANTALNMLRITTRS